MCCGLREIGILSGNKHVLIVLLLVAVRDSPVKGREGADIDFVAIADAGPFVITHVGIWDAVSAGNLLYHAALSVSKSFSLADVPRFPSGSLVVSVA